MPLLLLASASLLAACGGAGTPHPVSVSNVQLAQPTPAPVAPKPRVDLDTAEYRRSNSAVAVNALPAWQAGVSGKGVTIGVIDSGIDHGSPEFSGRISSQSRDVTGMGRTISDTHGHGTAVAMVAAAGRNGAGTVGIAPEATLAVMRADNGDCASGCRFSDGAIAAGIDAAVAAGARVINISLGSSGASLPLRDAFRRATAAGTVLVMSAGNDSAASVGALPLSALAAADPGAVIIAGSVNADGVISDFSNRAGTAAANTLMAMGERVLTTDHQGKEWLMSGTSFAAPAVAGAVALLAQYHPELSATKLVEILLSSADDAGEAGTDAIYGRGVMNLGRALSPIGATSLAGSTIAVPLGSRGSLGAAFGNGLATGDALAAVTVHDAYDRAYQLNLARQLRVASPWRLGGRLLSASLAEAQTSSHGGPVMMRLILRASQSAGRAAAPTALVHPSPGTEALGLALRGVDARAGSRNPLHETRLSLAAGPLQLTAAAGGQVAMVLPGSAASGFVSDDALAAVSPATMASGSSPQGNATLFAAQIVHGHWQAALAAGASRQRQRPEAGQPGRLSWQNRVAMAVSYADGPLSVAGRLTSNDETGGLLGTRLDPAYGLLGGRSLYAGLAIGWQLPAVDLRAAVTVGWHHPRLATAGLLRSEGAWHSQAWSLAARMPVCGALLSLRASQPLVVTDAPLRLANGVPLNAAATARETAAEVGLTWNGVFLAAFHRFNAGHQPGLGDSGAALSIKARF